MSDLEEYTLFWTIFNPSDAISIPTENGNIRFDIAEACSFPIYISGEELSEFNRDMSFKMTPLNMVAGALLGCRPPRPYIPSTGPSDLRPLLRDYLEGSFQKLGFDSLEELIFEIARILRDQNGCRAAAVALKNSEYLNVNFHKILVALSIGDLE